MSIGFHYSLMIDNFSRTDSGLSEGKGKAAHRGLKVNEKQGVSSRDCGIVCNLYTQPC